MKVVKLIINNYLTLPPLLLLFYFHWLKCLRSLFNLRLKNKKFVIS